jgi:ABC-type sugar transport system substrate-binding protein
MGRVAVESAVKAMRGERLPPDINVKLELVTKENAQ